MPYKRMAFKTCLNSGYFSTSEFSFDKLKYIKIIKFLLKYGPAIYVVRLRLEPFINVLNRLKPFSFVWFDFKRF
jgi:hypothetical protein